MAVKNMKVYECDLATCKKLHEYGRLPDGWVFYLHRRTVMTVDAQGRPTGNGYADNQEHEFCCEEHRDEWIKANV